MYEVNLFQFLVWLVLIALNVFFIWKYIHLNKFLKTHQSENHSITKSKPENKKKDPILNQKEINELNEIIKHIKKEKELIKNENIQRLIYFSKYVVDPINKIKVIQPDYSFDPSRIKINVKENLLNLFPNLTEQEVMLCTYIINGISTSEISLMLNLSNGTVRVYKNKLKTKLNVPSEMSLRQYLEKLVELD